MVTTNQEESLQSDYYSGDRSTDREMNLSSDVYVGTSSCDE